MFGYAADEASKKEQVWQSYIHQLGLFQATTHRRSMDTQMIRNLGKPIPILANRLQNDRPLAALLLLSSEERVQRRPLRLRLPARDVAYHSIGLMTGHELLRAQIDLPRQLLPRPRPATPLGDNHAIALLSRPLIRSLVLRRSKYSTGG